MDTEWIEQACAEFEQPSAEFEVISERGALCLKFKGPIKILTWCDLSIPHLPEETIFIKSIRYDILRTTGHSPVGNVNGQWPSCSSLEVNMYGQYLEPAGTCNFILIDDILLCVEENERLPKYESIHIFPRLQSTDTDEQFISYNVCAKPGGPGAFFGCSEFAKILSIKVSEEDFVGLIPSST